MAEKQKGSQEGGQRPTSLLQLRVPSELKASHVASSSNNATPLTQGPLGDIQDPNYSTF